MQVFRLLVLGIILVVIVGCSESGVSSPDDDVISNNIYENKYFSFSLPLPDGWIVADSQAIEVMWQTEMFAKNNPTPEATVAKAKQTTYHLLFISQKPIEIPHSDPSILIEAEKVSQNPNIKDGKDIILQLAIALIQQSPDSSLEKVYEYDLDGKPFYRADLVHNTPARPLRLSFISMVSKEYALLFVLTAQTEEEINNLEGMIKSGNFKSIPTEVVKSWSRSDSWISGIIGMILMIGGGLISIIAGLSKRRKIKTDENHAQET